MVIRDLGLVRSNNQIWRLEFRTDKASLDRKHSQPGMMVAICIHGGRRQEVKIDESIYYDMAWSLADQIRRHAKNFVASGGLRW